MSLKSGLNDVELLITATKVGSFALNHIEVMCGNSLLFVINYQQSIAELPSLDNVYLMIDLRLPTVELNSKPGLFNYHSNHNLKNYFRNIIGWNCTKNKSESYSWYKCN